MKWFETLAGNSTANRYPEKLKKLKITAICSALVRRRIFTGGR